MIMKKDLSICLTIVSTLIAGCLILGLTPAYAEPKRVITAEQQDAVMQKKQRKQAIKTEIAGYAAIEQQIDKVNNIEDVKAILKKLAKVAVLQSGGE